jgi:nucleotide-binding universal stress UspA family protein
MTNAEKIVVATDFTSGSRHPLNFAVDLAARSSAELHLFYAYIQRRVYFPDELRDRLVGMMPDAPENVHIQYHVDVGTAVAPCILDYAETQRADILVLGTRCPHSNTPGLLGDVTRKVLYHADIPVVTVDTVGTGPAPVESVLAPIDCSASSARVVEMARRYAHHFSARLDLLHVITEPLFPAFYPWAGSSLHKEAPDLEDRAIDALKAINEAASGPKVDARFLVRTGIPAEAILETVAEQNTGLLLMATHHCADRGQLPASNVTETVARYAPSPVCTIKTEAPGFAT